MIITDCIETVHYKVSLQSLGFYDTLIIFIYNNNNNNNYKSRLSCT